MLALFVPIYFQIPLHYALLGSTLHVIDVSGAVHIITLDWNWTINNVIRT
jgi:hypothetical protein